MIAFLDVYYSTEGACAAAVLCRDWSSCEPFHQQSLLSAETSGYEAGNFYRRELPPILHLLSALPWQPEIVVIDAYCYLSEQGAPGLGARLAESVASATKIVGIAKNRYKNTHHAIEVLRGTSKRPLFVTAVGMSAELAAEKISQMHGAHRLPTILRLVDKLSRQTSLAATEIGG